MGAGAWFDARGVEMDDRTDTGDPVDSKLKPGSRPWDRVAGGWPAAWARQSAAASSPRPPSAAQLGSGGVPGAARTVLWSVAVADVDALNDGSSKEAAPLASRAPGGNRGRHGWFCSGGAPPAAALGRLHVPQGAALHDSASEWWLIFFWRRNERWEEEMH